MTGGVPQYLSAYAWGDLGQIMNHTGPTLDILGALTDGQIVYVALPILARTEEATAMARMLIADLKQAVGSLQQGQNRPRVPYLVLMDEASAYMNVDGIERLFEQARSAGVGLVAAAQVASGFAVAGKAQQDFVFGNCATKIVMALGEFPSAELMAKTIGEELAHFRSATSATSKSRSAAWISPVPDRANRGQSESFGTSERYDYIIRPETFMQQRTGSAVVFIRHPETGAALHPDARLVCLELPLGMDEALRPPPRRNPRGLNLLTTIPQRETAPPDPTESPTTRRKKADAASKPRRIRRRDTPDFTVAAPAAPRETAATSAGDA
jgi:hypothetical protein